MDWSHVIYEMRVIFMLGFAPLAVWFIVKWVRYARATKFSRRDWLGAIAFWLGILSSALLGYSHAYFWVTHRLLSVEVPLILLGFGMAVGGLPLGFAGLGWVRRAAVFVLVVVAFQWANLILLGVPEYIVMASMFATLATGTLVWLGIHIRLARTCPGSR